MEAKRVKNKRLFRRRVAAADDADRDVAVKRAVASGARGQAVADELRFVGQSQPTRGGPAGDDQRAGVERFLVVELEREVTVLRLEAGQFGIPEPRAEVLGLRLHAQDEFGAVDAFGEAGKIFHQRGGRKLAAGLAAFEHDGIEAAARGVHGGGQARAARADDHKFFHDDE